MQRGASNVHFGVVCSALSIPPASEAVSLIIQEMRGVLDAVPESTLPTVLEGSGPATRRDRATAALCVSQVAVRLRPRGRS